MRVTDGVLLKGEHERKCRASGTMKHERTGRRRESKSGGLQHFSQRWDLLARHEGN
jgi:hypothetical protein